MKANKKNKKTPSYWYFLARAVALFALLVAVVSAFVAFSSWFSNKIGISMDAFVFFTVGGIVLSGMVYLWWRAEGGGK